jgi:oxygen-independent coproporphyrinogen-3 oxidase
MSPRKPSSPSSKSPTEPGTELGVYIHFPFCLSKCAYCDFDSLPLEAAGGLDAALRYLDAINIELDLRAASSEFHRAPVATIYLGGGTPTILPPERLAAFLARLRARFPIAPDAEITVEANPGTVDRANISALLEAGVNRFSLGVQSFSDSVLQTLGRAHTAAEAAQAIADLRAAGCTNLNLDLIYCIPHQTLTDWQDTLHQALAAQPEHISAYGLSVEDGTPLAADIESGRLPDPDEELYAEMYDTAAATLLAADYQHYEISNFARPGLHCRHNRRYWANAEYLGLGASAHSYRGGLRWNNLHDPAIYTEWLTRGILPVARAEALSAERRLGETLMLGLRCAEGVVEEQVAADCGLAPREVFEKEIQLLCDQGLLIAEDGALRIPREKWLISNEALSHFVV